MTKDTFSIYLVSSSNRNRYQYFILFWNQSTPSSILVRYVMVYHIVELGFCKNSTSLNHFRIYIYHSLSLCLFMFRSRSRSPSLSSDTSMRKLDRERMKRAERLRENNAARKIQRGWKSHKKHDQDEVLCI